MTPTLTSDPVSRLRVGGSRSFRAEHEEKAHFSSSASRQKSFAAQIGGAGWRELSREMSIIVLTLLLAAACLSSMPACQSTSARQKRQAIDSGTQEAVSTTRPKYDLRKLRSRLPGRSMKEVLAMLGKPGTVLSLGGGLESWDYFDAAYDSITERPIGVLTIWFENRRVDRISASF